MAVGDYVYDKTPAPPALLKAFDYKTFGVNVLDLAPGEVRAASTALNVYNAITGYRSAPAGQANKWIERNSGAYDVVTVVLAERMRRGREAENG